MLPLFSVSPRSVLLFLILVAITLRFAESRTLYSPTPQNTDCSFFSSNYSLSWSFDDLSNDVVFKLVTRSNFDNFYTAVGFGEGSTATDVISVYVRSGQIGLIDGHLADDGAIESDEKTNVQSLQFDFDDGVLTAQFARPIETFDSEDVDLSSCVTIFLPLEPREIISGVPLEFSGNSPISQRLRVCDIAVTCASNSHTEVVKREEDETTTAVCGSGPKSQKNRVEWEIKDDKLHFSVFQNVKKGRWWTAIGVGESMNSLDMVVFFAENGRLKQQGFYRTEGKMQPQPLDVDGGLTKEKGTMINNKSEFEVSLDKTFLTSKMNEKGCITLQISVLGGNYNPNFGIGKHKTTPQAIVVCDLEKCSDGEKAGEPNQKPVIDFQGESEAATSPAPAQLPAEVENTIPVTNNLSIDVADPVVSTTPPKLAEEVDVQGSGLSPSPAEVEENLTEASGALPAAEQATPSSTELEATKSVTQNEEKPLTNDMAVTQSGSAVNATEAPSSSPVSALSDASSKGSGCGVDHEDLKVCESYFAEYLGKVSEWSDRHNMTVAAHMWKACTLLSQVQHVTTMCCTIFRNTCAAQLNI